jgi:antitoxin component YwqK of YwqJK toxin-antitoxin module
MQTYHSGSWFMFYLLVGLLFFGCKGHTVKEVESTYENGKPKIVKYYKGEGQTRSIVKEIQYYSNGKIKVEGEYEEGKKNGQWIFYYESGIIWSQGFFKQGLSTGKTKVFHENGQLFYEGEYVEGKKQGNWSFYNEEGEPFNNVKFVDGKIESQPNTFDHVKDTSLLE